MSDWEVGDYALCIKVGPWTTSGGNISPDQKRKPVGGKVYRVEGKVSIKSSCFLCLKGVHALGAAGGRAHYKSDRFIKVTPEKADLYDQGIIALMNKETNHVDR